MSEEDPLPCRSCDGVLEEVEVDGRFVWMCRACGSALVEQPDLVPVLTDAARRIADAVSFDQPIDPVPRSPAPPCPDCDQQMVTFGYMGTNLVYPARCESCALIWAGPEVLGGMTMLFARTNLRNDTHVAHLQSEMDERTRRFNAVVMNRVREGWMM